ncbi:3-methyl-2-oxobutanoate hydroxymethyltransferase, variant 2 [Balamuthia mandrillaris]
MGKERSVSCLRGHLIHKVPPAAPRRLAGGATSTRMMRPRSIAANPTSTSHSLWGAYDAASDDYYVAPRLYSSFSRAFSFGGSGQTESASSVPSPGWQERLYSVHAAPAREKTRARVTSLRQILEKHKKGVPLTMITAYDYASSAIVERAGADAIDMILVGDSLGMVQLGYDNTVPVTMDDMLLHCKAVKRGCSTAFVVGDLPFGSYEVSDEEAVRNALRLLKEGGVHAVKLEGGKRMADRVRALVKAGIAVVGHIGLTPQTASAQGGIRVQGKTAEEAKRVVEDALALQDSGCFAIVLECVPEKVAAHITQMLHVPTIGIGAGNGCSGQVLVWHDLLGLYQDLVPKFCKRYASLGEQATVALQRYGEEVRSRRFPAKEHTFCIRNEDFAKLIEIYPLPHEKNEQTAALSSVQTPGASTTMHSGNKQTIMIIGAGAMGSLLGAHLLKAGHQVCFVDSWHENVAHLQRDGLKVIEDIAGHQSKEIFRMTSGEKNSICAFENGSDILQRMGESCVDVALVMTKGYDTERALASSNLTKLMKSGGAVLTLQNGMGNKAKIEAAMNAVRLEKEVEVLEGVIDYGALMARPGEVKLTGRGSSLIGYGSGRHSKAIAQLLNEAGIQAEITENIAHKQWQKLIINAAINPLTALFSVPNGQLLVTSPTISNILHQVVHEGVTVASAAGIQLGMFHFTVLLLFSYSYCLLMKHVNYRKGRGYVRASQSGGKADRQQPLIHVM